MVFVHSRKDTSKTAEQLIDIAREHATIDQFSLQTLPNFHFQQKEVFKSRNKQIKELFPYGFGVHHAGLLVSDNRLMERLFAQGELGG
jgi:activating signal cointegrator complex subunit 3